MAYNPQNPNGQATMANSSPVVLASDQSDLPVDVKSIEGFYDAGNSSTTPLAGGGTFTGAAIEITNYSAINVAVYSDVVSATNGFQMQFSPDGTNWDHSHNFTLSTVPGGLSYAQAAELRYFRVVYINGVSAQATFRLTTVLKTTNVSPSRYTVAQAVTATQMADVVKAVIYGETSGGGGGYVDVKVNPSGALTVEADITNGAGGAAVNIQDGGNSITVDGTVTANVGTTGGLALDATLTGGTQKTRITDGTTDAEVVPLTNYNGVAVAVVDGSGNQITSFGGGTQYADGDARGSATGTLMMVDDGSNIQSAAGTATGELKTVTVPNTSGGLSANRLTVTNTAQNVNSAGAAGQVYGWYVYNPNTTIAYVQFFNSAAAGVTVGTTAPLYSIGIPGLSAANVFNSIGISHGSGISIAATTLPTGSVAPGSSLEVNVFYK